MKRITPQQKESLRARVLRLLGTNRHLQEPSSDHEKAVHSAIPRNDYSSYRKEIETAWSEAERKKTEALMELQKRRFIC